MLQIAEALDMNVGQLFDLAGPHAGPTNFGFDSHALQMLHEHTGRADRRIAQLELAIKPLTSGEFESLGRSLGALEASVQKALTGIEGLKTRIQRLESARAKRPSPPKQGA